MKNYDKCLIKDYVLGNDILEYDIEKLENDPEFMIKVIKYTKDKNTYRLCSKNVKEDYNFVRFMVETFKEDKKFIRNIADNFLSLKKSFNQKLELLIIMKNLIDKDDCLDYWVKLAALETEVFTEIIGILNSIKDGSLKDTVGEGFFFVTDSYGESKIITDYFATKMVDRIFYSNSLELFLHENFKDYKQIEEHGINNFIVSYLSRVDSFLSSYVAANISLVSDLKKDIEKVGRNWDMYLEKINRLRIIIVYDEVMDYAKKEKIIPEFSFSELIMHVANEQGLENIFKKYDFYNEEFTSYNCFLNNKRDLNFIKLYRFISELIYELFSKDVIKQDSSDYDEEKLKSGQVLSFKKLIKSHKKH